MLTADAVVPYLFERGLLEEGAVADENLNVQEVSRRNHNFKLLRDRGTGYFLKQGRSADTARTVAREARIYQWFSSPACAESMAPLLPRCRFYDPDEITLVLELVEGAQSLFEYQWRHRRVTGAIGTALGDALGVLHRLTGLAVAGAAPVPGPAARFLQLHRPGLDLLATASAGSVEVISIVQQCSELSETLDRLNQEWLSACVIHGDLRWDNCQVVLRPGHSAPAVHFVDWEMAGVGDPRWDVGTVFSECLSTWLLSAPATRDTPPEDFLPLARSPLEQMQPAMRAFWQSYVGRSGLEAATAAAWLERSVQYAGARLVQTAYEAMQGAVRLTANVVYMLQLSANIVARPVEAATLLLGIPAAPSGGR